MGQARAQGLRAAADGVHVVMFPLDITAAAHPSPPTWAIMGALCCCSGCRQAAVRLNRYYDELQ